MPYIKNCSTYVYGGAEYKSYLDPNSKTEKWFLERIGSVPAQTQIEYRYAERSKNHTYYYQTIDEKESKPEVTASDAISNVQKWVQYIVK